MIDCEIESGSCIRQENFRLEAILCNSVPCNSELNGSNVRIEARRYQPLSYCCYMGFKLRSKHVQTHTFLLLSLECERGVEMQNRFKEAEGDKHALTLDTQLKVIMLVSGSCSVGDGSGKVSYFASGFATYKRELYNSMVAGSVGFLGN